MDYPCPMPHEFKPARRLARHRVWQGAVGTFGVDEVELDTGVRTRLAVLEHPGAAAVVPFVGPGEILLLRQYRYAVRRTLWEVPAGKLDPGEDPSTCAARELEEETGHRAGRVESVGLIHTTPGFTDEVIHLFVAGDLRETRVARERDERIEVVRVRLQDALDWIGSGEITDAKTICALHHAERHAPPAT